VFSPPSLGAFTYPFWGPFNNHLFSKHFYVPTFRRISAKFWEMKMKMSLGRTAYRRMVTPWPHNLGEMGTGGPVGVCVVEGTSQKQLMMPDLCLEG
jgi:hypothetical protein